MKCLIFTTALILAGLFHQVAHADAEALVECFSSAEAAREAYPGSHVIYTSHATGWTESSKCWFAGQPVVKPRAKPRAAAAVALASPEHIARAMSSQPEHEVKGTHEENAAVEGTYEENAAALRALMFGPDESPTDFAGRFSAVENAPSFLLWRRCFATPTWDLCQSST
jgi:hypothetical protein